MADVAPRKRARSPSPAYGDTLASPLEVLLKRRRRDTYASSRMPPPPVWGAPSLSNNMDEDDPPSSSHGHSSPLRRGDEYFERRRQRQWERLQAPSLSQPAPALPDSSPFRSHPQLQRSITNDSMTSEYELEVGRNAFALSSSPVRHQPPGSTPFRATEWTPEERAREWGDEYVRQNSLLHSLHLARAESHQSHFSHQTPPSPIQHTPERPMDMSSPHRTPFTAPPSSAALPTPYRMRGGHETPGLAISSPWASSPLHSPYAPHAPASAPAPAFEPEVAVRYEEANRLLAELNVARMRRHRDE